MPSIKRRERDKKKKRGYGKGEKSAVSEGKKAVRKAS